MRLGLLVSAQQHLDPDSQFIRPEGLDEVVIPTAAQADEAVVEMRELAEHQDGSFQTRFAHRPGDLQAVTTRQHPVKGDRIKLAAECQLQSLGAVETGLSLEATAR